MADERLQNRAWADALLHGPLHRVRDATILARSLVHPPHAARRSCGGVSGEGRSKRTLIAAMWSGSADRPTRGAASFNSADAVSWRSQPLPPMFTAVTQARSPKQSSQKCPTRFCDKTLLSQESKQTVRWPSNESLLSVYLVAAGGALAAGTAGVAGARAAAGGAAGVAAAAGAALASAFFGAALVDFGLLRQ